MWIETSWGPVQLRCRNLDLPMKPSKITPAVRARCEQIALLKLKIPSYKDLEIETGIHRNYLAKIVHEIVLEHSKENSSANMPQRADQ